MLLPALLLFILFLLLGAFFSSSETAFVSASPIKIDYLEKKGSKQVKLVKKLLSRMDRMLATTMATLLILIYSEVNPKTYAAFNPVKLSFLWGWKR